MGKAANKWALGCSCGAAPMVCSETDSHHWCHAFAGTRVLCTCGLAWALVGKDRGGVPRFVALPGDGVRQANAARRAQLDDGFVIELDESESTTLDVLAFDEFLTRLAQEDELRKLKLVTRDLLELANREFAAAMTTRKRATLRRISSSRMTPEGERVRLPEGFEFFRDLDNRALIVCGDVWEDLGDGRVRLKPYDPLPRYTEDEELRRFVLSRRLEAPATQPNGRLLHAARPPEQLLVSRYDNPEELNPTAQRVFVHVRSFKEPTP